MSAPVGFAHATDAAGRLAPSTPAAELVVATLRGVAPEQRLAVLETHGVPPAAVDALLEPRDVPVWQDAVVASFQRGQDLELALSATAGALAAVDVPIALAVSVLGPLWWRDLDLIVAPEGSDSVAELLVAAGFIDVTTLAGGEARFAAVADHRILAAVDVHTAAGLAARAVAGRGLAVIAPEDALRRRAGKVAAARHVRLRDVVELAELARAAPSLAGEPVVAAALTRARSLERAFGVAGVVPSHPSGRRVPITALVPAAREAARRRLRRRRLPTVAFSGIDGSGKSTQARLLADALERLGCPVATVWARIGYSGSRWLTRGVNRIQRILPREWHSALGERAVDTSRTTPRTRRGMLGWTWALVVTVDYLITLRRDLWAARGRLVVLDRGLPDALVGLEEGFGGAVPLTLHRRLLRRWGPRTSVTFLLDLPARAAVGRKQDDFSARVLDQHGRRYRSILSAADATVVMLDAGRPAEVIAVEVLRILARRG